MPAVLARLKIIEERKEWLETVNNAKLEVRKPAIKTSAADEATVEDEVREVVKVEANPEDVADAEVEDKSKMEDHKIDVILKTTNLKESKPDKPIEKDCVKSKPEVFVKLNSVANDVKLKPAKIKPNQIRKVAQSIQV